MSPNITLITLGVADVAKATAFYERLGFVKSKTASQESVSFFRAGGVVLAGPRGTTGGCASKRDLERQWQHRRCTKCRKRSRGRCCNGKGRGRRRANLEACG